MAKTLIPTDPLFAQQWFLLNTGQNIAGAAQAPGAYRNDLNVTPVWPDYTGAGVRVAVFDDGVNGTHPDLAPNYLSGLAYDFVSKTASAEPVTADDNHGTAVAGLVGAARNSIGGVGVAYGAQLVGYAGGGIGEGQTAVMPAFTEAALRAGVDVVNNSWGTTGGAQPLRTAADQPVYEASFKRLASEGRGGLGTVVVFAAGNDRDTNFLTTYDPTNSSRFALNVAAAKADGSLTSYSTAGPNILVTAPGSDPSSIVTTDRVGGDGYNARKNGDYTDTSTSYFNGTSSAAPMVSGVVALMLQANPNLGYRDVQEILAASARTVGQDSLATRRTVASAATTDWNGGAYLYSTDFGFGNVDARAAVRMAETWTKQSTEANVAALTGRIAAPVVYGSDSFGGSLKVNLASGTGATLLRVQHVTVDVSLSATYASTIKGMSLSLTDAAGRSYNLMSNPMNLSTTSLSYSFDVTGDWGTVLNSDKTSAEGDAEKTGQAAEFTVSLDRSSTFGSFTVNSLSITAHGDLATNDRTYVYTNDYASLAKATPARELLKNPVAGNHTINAAAVSGDSVIDLRPDGTGSIDGAYFEAADGMTVASVYTGDGNDRIYGNAMDNVIGAGRGTNLIDGGGGTNTAVLIGEHAKFRLGLDAGGITVGSTDGETKDTLTNIQSLRFADTTVDLGEARAGRIEVGSGAGQFGSETDGTVSYLQWQFIATSSQDLLLGAKQANTFLHGGSGNDALAVVGGRNVLDGGTGSNWLVGGADAASGTDTFFLSGLLDSASPATWDTVVNFHAGDMLTVWGYDAARDTYAWSDGDGAQGYTGATISFAGNGREGMDKVTLAGISSSDPTLAVTTGSVGGRSYLAVTHLS